MPAAVALTTRSNFTVNATNNDLTTIDARYIHVTSATANKYLRLPWLDDTYPGLMRDFVIINHSGVTFRIKGKYCTVYDATNTVQTYIEIPTGTSKTFYGYTDEWHEQP